MRIAKTPILPTTVLAIALVVAGCGGDNGGSDERSDGPTWPKRSDPVPTDTLAFSRAGSIRITDGPRLDAETKPAAFVIAGDGAFFVPDNSSELRYVDTDGVRATGAHADGGSLRASPDGRFIVFIDYQSGPKDQYDTPLAETVVVDTERGREVARTSEGLGDTKDDDLADLYEDASPGTLGITEDAAYVDGVSGNVVEIDLETGEVSSSDEGDLYAEPNPWVTPRYTDDLNSGDYNADRTWAIDPDPDDLRDGFIDADGKRLAVDPGTPTWKLERWIDATTAVGTSWEGPPVDGMVDGESARQLITCTVPDGACETVADSASTTDYMLLPNPSRV